MVPDSRNWKVFFKIAAVELLGKLKNVHTNNIPYSILPNSN